MENEEKVLETIAEGTNAEGTAAETVAEVTETVSENTAEAAAETVETVEEAAKPAKEDRKGQKKAHKPVDPAVWDELKANAENGDILSVKINTSVNAGVIAYVKGIRGFIPASLLSIAYVEDLSAWVGKTIDVKVITVEPESKRLVLSGKAVEQEKAEADKAEKLASVEAGQVYEGKVERLAAFGAFVGFNEGLTGLVHISQIANRRIETPAEVLKVGDTVKVKVLGVKDGKISLSIRAAEENGETRQRRNDRFERSERSDRPERSYSSRPRKEKEPVSYKDEGKATTNLGSILANIKLD
ncbi:MAG: S1 RNA-binding domain-containing protein [Lachnospiraceae bacterium]|nr:S1 RNA-binding domain-containing protein [Lachnospiraceae bacterium]